MFITFSFTVQHTAVHILYTIYYFVLIYPSCGQGPLIALTDLETWLGSSCCDSLLAISVTNPCVYSLLWLMQYIHNLLSSNFLLFKESSTAWNICCYRGTAAQCFLLLSSSECPVWSCLYLLLQTTLKFKNGYDWYNVFWPATPMFHIGHTQAAGGVCELMIKSLQNYIMYMHILSLNYIMYMHILSLNAEISEICTNLW